MTFDAEAGGSLKLPAASCLRQTARRSCLCEGSFSNFPWVDISAAGGTRYPPERTLVATSSVIQ